MNRGDWTSTQGRVIYNFTPISRTMTLTIEEFKSLINHYDYGHPHRLAFLLMGCYGLRSVEVCNIKFDMFFDEAKFLVYPIAKSTSKVYKTGTRTVHVKTRRVELFSALRKEVKWYLENNYHMFKNRFIFGFSKDSLRRYLARLRRDAENNVITDPVLKKLLLDQEGSRYGFGINVQNAYRFTLHSFRRFFITYFYNVVSGKDIVFTQLEIGHQLKETTMIYVKRPEAIGLPDGIKGKVLDFESLFYAKNQKTLKDYN